MQTPAIIAARTFGAGQAVQPQRPPSPPRRMEPFDLADLSVKTAPAIADAPPRPDNAAARTDARPARPGTLLDIKV